MSQRLPLFSCNPFSSVSCSKRKSQISLLQKVNIPSLDWSKQREDNQGWIQGEGNIKETLWPKGKSLPQPVVDLLDANLNDELAKNGEGVGFEESSGFEENDKDTEV